MIKTSSREKRTLPTQTERPRKRRGNQKKRAGKPTLRRGTSERKSDGKSRPKSPAEEIEYPADDAPAPTEFKDLGAINDLNAFPSPTGFPRGFQPALSPARFLSFVPYLLQNSRPGVPLYLRLPTERFCPSVRATFVPTSPSPLSPDSDSFSYVRRSPTNQRGGMRRERKRLRVFQGKRELNAESEEQKAAVHRGTLSIKAAASMWI